MGAFQRHLPQGLLRWNKPPRTSPPIGSRVGSALWSWERFWLEYEPNPHASRSSLFSSESQDHIRSGNDLKHRPSLSRSAPGTSQVPDAVAGVVTSLSCQRKPPRFRPPRSGPCPERRKTYQTARTDSRVQRLKDKTDGARSRHEWKIEPLPRASKGKGPPGRSRQARVQPGPCSARKPAVAPEVGFCPPASYTSPLQGHP